MKWFLYRFDWNQEKQKYNKAPCTLDGKQWPVDIESVWLDDRQHVERCLDSLPQAGAACYWLGMKSEPHEKLFFLDLDHCVNDGQLDAASGAMAASFLAAGAYFEGTSSGTGVHIVGRYTGELPDHCHKRPSVHAYEFYTENQGVAINRTANSGSWDVDCTAILHNVLRDWFPPRQSDGEVLAYESDRPRADWDGPTDDDALIAKALAAGGSAAARFGGALTFRQLWEGQCDKSSESDLALASHLAFWTGCHAVRIERLMRRSGLVRDKWNSHRTYLRELTIDLACSTTKNVYKQIRVAVPALIAQVQDSSVDWHKITQEVVDRIHGCGDLKVLAEDIMPAIGPMGIPVLYGERVVQALAKRLALFDSKVPLAKLRTIVNPPRMSVVENNVVVPDWATSLCYITFRDRFMDVTNGSTMSAEGLRMTYANKMPYKNNGQREDVVTFCRERWNIPVVDDVLYRPDQPAFFIHGGMKFANLFTANSMPVPVEPSADAVECIELFKAHMFLMCGQRMDVYTSLLLWLAHNIQFPGRKIRWSPLVKGVQGDGKSIVLDLILATMGIANVKLTSQGNLNNSGGFTDWATGKAVNVIEEIRLVGKEKHRLFNAMKIFIGDTLIDLNRKGRASGESLVNVTNHWANTNYEDAVPVDNKERRWMVVFSPYCSIEDAVRAKGLASVDDLVAQFKRMGQSMRREPGGWRAWLLGLDTSQFDPDGRAPVTDERLIMAEFSEEPIEGVIREVLESGCPGVTIDVFSSSMLRRALKIRAQMEDLQIPSSSAWHSMLAALGYRPWPRAVKVHGLTQRLWIRQNFHAQQEDLLEIMRKSLPNLSTCNL